MASGCSVGTGPHSTEFGPKVEGMFFGFKRASAARNPKLGLPAETVV